MQYLQNIKVFFCEYFIIIKDNIYPSIMSPKPNVLTPTHSPLGAGYPF